MQERVNKKRAYFHMVAWSIPCILTVSSMFSGVIEGDHLSGICIVNSESRILLLLVPLAVATIVGEYFGIRGNYSISMKYNLIKHVVINISYTIVQLQNCFGRCTLFVFPHRTSCVKYSTNRPILPINTR